LRHRQNAEIAHLSGRTATLTTGEKIEADVIICATGANNQKAPVIGKTSFVPHDLSDDKLYRGLIVPCAPRIVFINPHTLGNILDDSTRVGKWLRRCYLPTLSTVGEQGMCTLLQHGLAEQNAECNAVRSRRFNPWHSFDRPVPWMYHVIRELAKETKSGKLTTETKNVVAKSSGFSGWVYRQFVYPVLAGIYILYTHKSTANTV